MFELLLRNHRSNHLHLNKIIFNQYKNRKYLQKKKYIVESLKKILIQIFLLNYFLFFKHFQLLTAICS